VRNGLGVAGDDEKKTANGGAWLERLLSDRRSAFRTEGARQDSPGQDRAASAALGQRFGIDCTLKACGEPVPRPTHQEADAMAQSLARILVHLVYSTKHRAPLLPAEPYRELHAYSHGIFKDRKCHLIEMNNVADHVHALFDLHRTASVADVVMHVKKGTSRWLKEQGPEFSDFDWQDGYGAFSIGRSQRVEVVSYVRNQQERHVRISYQDEFRKFLESYEIEYDERYVWD
jgi:putative transposase